MKILIPTDFSELSITAALYATRLASRLKAEAILLHVCHSEIPSMAHTLAISEEIEKNVHEWAYEQTHLIEQKCLEVASDVKFSCKIVEGYPIENAIQEFCSKKNIDLIVMGAEKISGLETLLGSNAFEIMNQSQIPVLFVPEHQVYRDWRHIVYASDTLHISTEIRKLIPLAKILDAYIHILHILSEKSEKEDEIIPAKLPDSYEKMTFHQAHDLDVVHGIESFISQRDVDLLVLFHHQYSLYEQLFKRNTSQEILSHHLIPLLIINKENSL